MNNVNKPNEGEQNEVLKKQGTLQWLMEKAHSAFMVAINAWKDTDIPSELLEFKITRADLEGIVAECEKAVEEYRKKHGFPFYFYSLADWEVEMNIVIGVLEMQYSGFVPQDRERVNMLTRYYVLRKMGYIPDIT